jgi:hypothetical protein
MDASGGLGMDVLRDDPQMYMSPGEVMAFFNDGSMDVSHLFSADAFLQAHSPTQSHHQTSSQGLAAAQPSQTSTLRQS